MSADLIGIAIYVALQLAIGVYVSRRITSEASYLLADRSLGYGLAGFSLFATWLGAETCIGSAGEVYATGVRADTVEPFAYAACLVFMGAAFAAPLWRRGFTTVADLFRERYTPGVERLVVVLVVPASLLWAAAQLRAFGQVLAVSADVSLPIAMGIAAAIAVVYTTFGGLLADSVTDFVQGLVLALGLGILAIALATGDTLGGAATDPAALDAAALVGAGMVETSGEDVPPSLLAILEAWAIPICGSVLAQEIIARVLGARSAEVARRAAIGAGVAYLAIGLIPVAAGLVGASRMPGLDDPEQLLLLLARDAMPGLLYVVFAGALVSAILSTVDSTLLAAASLTSHNLVASVRPGLTDRARLRLARTGVVAGGAIAFALALRSDGVLELVEQASAFGSSGVFVVGCFGLWTRVGGPAAAYVALLLGGGVYVGGNIVGVPAPYVASLVVAGAAYLAVASLERQGTAAATVREAA